MMKNIEVPIAKRMLEIYASAVDGKINVTTEIIEAANTLYAQQAEIERLKGELEDEIYATHKHLKRGTFYQVVGVAELQAVHSVVEGEQLTIYRSLKDGTFWARPKAEFNDGRFETLLPKQKEGE